MKSTEQMKIAIVHEWFVDYSGSERVVEQILEVFPQADLFAQVDFLAETQRGFIKNKPVTTGLVQRLPRARTSYRQYLPLMPFAVEQFDLSAYDLVVSSNHAVSKGVITGPDQLHICYCHSPMRYAWDLTHQYLKQSGLDRGLKGLATRLILHYMRQWDYRTAAGVDAFIANSNFISRRIQKVYRRDSEVIYPPVNVDAFQLQLPKEDFYLTASRMVPYKRIDLIVESFARMPDKRLIVIGDGPEMDKIRAVSAPNVELMGYQNDEFLRDHLKRGKAFVFAAEEDFGIIPVEAQACGTPVIAYGKGGALETVIDGETGLFFHEQSPEALVEAIRTFENISHRFDPERIREHALYFSRERFRTEFKQFVDDAVARHFESARPSAGQPDSRVERLPISHAG